MSKTKHSNLNGQTIKPSLVADILHKNPNILDAFKSNQPPPKTRVGQIPDEVLRKLRDDLSPETLNTLGIKRSF